MSAPAQVSADWNATSGAAQILNKPTIPADWSQAVANLTKVVYINHIYANLTASPSTVYKGVASDITITYSGGISGSTATTSYSLKKNDTTITLASGGKDNVTLNATTTNVKYHLDVRAGGVTKGADATVNAYWPIFTFGSTKADGYTTAEICNASWTAATGVTKQEARWSPAGATYSITVPANGYFCIAFADGSISSAKVGGFNAPLTKATDVTINSITYHIYRCAEAQSAGTYSVNYN